MAAHLPFHALAADEVLAALQSSPAGLHVDEAHSRLKEYGPNRLPPPRRRSALFRFLLQFHNLLIYVLLAAAAGTALLGHYTDTLVIIGVVVVNALIGFVQEGKAERAIEAIRHILSLRATVEREGHRVTIDAADVVPGDVVFIQSGDKVPADLRLFYTKDLMLNEAALTGESLPVLKQTEPVAEAAAMGDRLSIAFSSTFVTRGRGMGVVVATGEHAEIGRISGMLNEVRTLDTTLTRKMAQFSRLLTIIIAVLAATTFGMGLLWGTDPADLFLASVAVAVSMIPEGLPAIITITLAIGVQRMARRNAVIRRLPAVETLGAVTVICSDKTGTLTRNEMTVRTLATAQRVLTVEGAGYEPSGGFAEDGQAIDPSEDPVLMEAARTAILCNDSSVVEQAGGWVCSGDPTECALLTLAHKADVNAEQTLRAHPPLDAIPFESEHRYMASLRRRGHNQAILYVKGAPERLLEMCAAQRTTSGDEPLDRAGWMRRIEAIAHQGQRLLGLACRPWPAEHARLSPADVRQLVMLAVVGIEDPPRAEATAAVAECRSGGIRVKMITGDHVATARTIGARMHIGDGVTALSGGDLDALTDEQLIDAVAATDVFARVSPEHKLRLVEALQARGEVVAMTGDGVNDAPALKRADVGVAMGVSGTEVAKEAAEMVLSDDNFASIAQAVAEGRTVFDNIRKAIGFMLPTNAAQTLTIVAAIASGRMLPITPRQILWVNLITSVTLTIALAFERAEPGVMRRRPRPPKEPILTPFLLWRIGFVSVLMFAATLGMFLYERAGGATLEYARTVAVNMLVMLEAAYVFNSRFLLRRSLSIEGLFGSWIVLAAVATVAVAQVMLIYVPPLPALFEMTPLTGWTWLRIHAVAFMVFLIVELEKTLIRRRRRPNHPHM